MAVGFSNTNKPLNPRGQDASPKGYNRASLFSGKALDFDGVNDYVDCGSIEVQSFSLITNVYLDLLSNTDTLAGNWDSSNGFMLYKNASNNMFVYINSAKVQTDISQYVGNWTQFVATYDGTTAKLYANGVLINSEAYAATITYSSGSTFKVGAYGNTPGGLLNGDVAGTKLFNTTLTAEQVADLYNNPEKVVPTGLESNLKLWLPMMEGAGTTAYNGAPDALGSNVVTNGTFDTDSDWTKGTGWSIGSGKATRSGASSNTFIGQDFNVVSGTTYILKYNRTYISGGGETNAYSYFDGSTSRVTRGQYIGTAQETVTVLDTFTPTFSGNLAFRFYGIGTFTGSIDNIEIKPISGIGTISGATWTHGIGAPVSQTSVIDWNKIQAKTNGGTLSEPLIPQGLTSGRDLLGNLFENVRKQGALNLDGNSWAEVHDNESLDITPAMTMECWVDFSEIDSTAYRHFIVKPSGATWASPYARYALRGSNASVQWWFESAGFVEVYSVSLTGWNHIAVTKDGTAEILYINGAQVDTATNNATITASAENLLLGQATTGTEPLDSPIAQPRIYNRALTASEVLRNYNSGKNTYTND